MLMVLLILQDYSVIEISDNSICGKFNLIIEIYIDIIYVYIHTYILCI